MVQDIMRRETNSASGLQTDPIEEVIETLASTSAEKTEAYIKQAQILMDAAMQGVTGGPLRDHGPPYVNLGPNKCDMVSMILGPEGHTCVETCKDTTDALRTAMGMTDGDCLSREFYTHPAMVGGVPKFNAICMGIHNVSYYNQASAATGGSDLAEGVVATAAPSADDACGDVYHSLVKTADADHCQTLCVGDASKVQAELKMAGSQPGNCTESDVGYTEYLGTMEVRIVIKLDGELSAHNKEDIADAARQHQSKVA